jgi:NPCBM/NEW2 domain
MHAFVLSLLLVAQTDVPEFVAMSHANERPQGQLARLTPEFSAALRTKSGLMKVSDVIALRRVDRVVPGFPTSAHLVTTAGDRIAGTVAGGDGQILRFLPSGISGKRDDAWKIPLSSVVVLWLTDTPANTPLDANRYEWLTEVKNQDVLRYRNGDLARGTIDGLDPDAATPTFPFRPSREELRSIPSRELAAVAFNPALARSRKPKGPYCRVVLADGSRLSLTSPTVADGMLSATSLFGEKIRISLTDVVAIDNVAGKGVNLSDLKPKKIDQAGFLGVVWPLGLDRTARGQALQVSTVLGDTFADKGLGTHPRTTLSYDLGGKYQRFEALVGLDPTNSHRARVAVRVLVDGKEQSVPGLGTLAVGNAVDVRIDVRSAKELVLITDFAPAGGVGGDVNWVDARLIE